MPLPATKPIAPPPAFRLEKAESRPQAATPIQRGLPCPQCGGGPLDYNGLLELECPQCGYSTSSGAGCT